MAEYLSVYVHVHAVHWELQALTDNTEDPEPSADKSAWHLMDGCL